MVQSHSLFAIYEGDANDSQVLANWFRGEPVQWLRSLEPGFGLDLFVPEPGDNAVFVDGAGPAVMLEFSCPGIARLKALAADAEFRTHFFDRPAQTAPGTIMSFGIFRTLPTPVDGADKAEPRTAGLSFFVRYYGPMPDEAGFQRFYTRNHPPILARFPAIRNVFCYLPVDGAVPMLPTSAIRLGNEVVFDDLDHLNAALKSQILPELRADSAKFPPFGHSTHHAMKREKLGFSAI